MTQNDELDLLLKTVSKDIIKALAVVTVIGNKGEREVVISIDKVKNMI
jgi:hypothetical protein